MQKQEIIEQSVFISRWDSILTVLRVHYFHNHCLCLALSWTPVA